MPIIINKGKEMIKIEKKMKRIDLFFKNTHTNSLHYIIVVVNKFACIYTSNLKFKSFIRK